jgi:aspartate-semialdehyde dehydrogenase
MLQDHPWFQLSAITASQSSVGKKYSTASNWYLESEIPKDAADMTVLETNPDAVTKAGDIKLVFSALPSSIARELEPSFSKEGFAVASNASAYRMDETVPLLIPEINVDHLKLIARQRRVKGTKGFIVASPNCSTYPLVMALKPIYDNFGIRRLIVSTMQAISGAGYSGLPSMAILENVIPFVPGEEEKMETETLKILGKLANEEIVDPADFKVSASCNRVPVYDGHTETVSIETINDAKPEEVIKVLNEFKGYAQKNNLPSAPEKPIVLRSQPDRPQPRIDRDEGNGMSVVVGRIRREPVFETGIKFVVLGHNTIRGAAGGSIINAEALYKEGYI